MRRALAISIAITLACAQTWAAAPRLWWNRIRYRGGTVHAKVSAFDWNTTLTLTPDAIDLLINPNTRVHIKPSQVISISYGQEARRRVADVAALNQPYNPPALFGLLHVGKKHLIGIVYYADDGKEAAVLLESYEYQFILLGLKSATGKPIEGAP